MNEQTTELQPVVVRLEHDCIYERVLYSYGPMLVKFEVVKDENRIATLKVRVWVHDTNDDVSNEFFDIREHMPPRLDVEAVLMASRLWNEDKLCGDDCARIIDALEDYCMKHRFVEMSGRVPKRVLTTVQDMSEWVAVHNNVEGIKSFQEVDKDNLVDMLAYYNQFFSGDVFNRTVKKALVEVGRIGGAPDRIDVDAPSGTLQRVICWYSTDNGEEQDCVEIEVEPA